MTSPRLLKAPDLLSLACTRQIQDETYGGVGISGRACQSVVCLSGDWAAASTHYATELESHPTKRRLLLGLSMPSPASLLAGCQAAPCLSLARNQPGERC